MNTTPTLGSVQADFHTWRQDKVHLRSRTPDMLRHKALALLAYHSPIEIQKALSITQGMLNKWGGNTVQCRSHEPKPVEFVALPTEPPPAKHAAERLMLELTQTKAGGKNNLSS